MRTEAFCFSALLLTFTAAISAGAQSSRPRVGYAAPPKPPAQQTAPQAQVNALYYVTGAPFLVLTDGTVLVNFGNGYERVLRQCQQAPAPTTDANGLDALGRIPLPLNSPLRSGDRGQVAGTMPERNVTACYRTSKRHKVEIVKG